jgi:phage recombination protein Bet
MSQALVLKQVSQLAETFGIPESEELVTVLKATAFKGQVSDAQMSALLIVASQYGLNPWTKEIYAFPDQNNGIVPVVGVDGWSRIINSHPQFDGLDFEQDDEACTCIIYRKDRSHPVRVTEYLSECKRPVKPWQSHPKRMLRHKALIQCARLAFGYVGIFDLDEAERIAEPERGMTDITPAPAALSQDWVAAAAACKTAEEMTAVWTIGIKEVQASGNMDLYKAFKSIVESRGKELKAEAAAAAAMPVEQPPVERVEPMTDAEIEATDLARTGGQP